MTETLSTQLCKLAGIEAKYYFKASAGDWVRGTEYAYNHRVDVNDKWKEIYPDFEADTDNARFNFIRLLEIYSKRNAFVYVDKKKLLFDLVRSCILANDTSNSKYSWYKGHLEIKQALASTDWRL